MKPSQPLQLLPKPLRMIPSLPPLAFSSGTRVLGKERGGDIRIGNWRKKTGIKLKKGLNNVVVAMLAIL